jgi:hypothetical protein
VLQRVKKRHKLQAEQSFHRRLEHIKEAAVQATEKTCDRLYGFHANPDLSLRKNFNKAIRTRDCRLMKNQPWNLAYHNLCTIKQPPLNTDQLLGLNLKYCIAAPTPKPDLSHTVPRLEKSVRTQNMLIERKVKSQHFIQQLFKQNHFYSPPLATDELEYKLTKFEEKLEAAAEALPKTCQSNLTPTQQKVLNSLKNNPDYIILPTDKNLGPAIMNRSVYKERVLTEHLLSDAYIYMPTDQATAFLKKTAESLKFLYRQNKHLLSKPERQYFERSFIEKHRTPMFYIIPKVQKDPVKYRPVVSCVNSFNAVFSKWLDFKMKSLLSCIPTYLKDSNALLTDIENLPKLPANAKLFTADATAMYTNIDTDTALEAFSFLFEHYNEEIPSDFPKALFLSVLEIVMKRNLFQFDDTYWLQKDGTAMGTPTACLHATISYGVHERNRILPTYKDFLLLYKRFIDDVFGIWIPHDNGLDDLAWSEFKNTMNEWGKLRWIVSDRTTSVDFLDLNLTINNGRILTRTFQKSMNLYLYIPPISAHPTSCFKGLIVGNFLRFRKQNNDENFCILLRNFAHHLLARGHSLKAIRKIFRNAANLTDNKRLLPIRSPVDTPPAADPTTPLPDPTIANRSLYLHWEYHPSGIKREQLREIFKSTLADCNPFQKGMIVAMARPKNLRDILTRTTLNEPEGERASDYYRKICTDASPASHVATSEGNTHT